MNVTQAIKQRHSCRAFTKQDVDIDTIKQIIDTAKFAPSGVNTQPWQVAVVTGETKQQLTKLMLDAFRSKQTESMDYKYYPDTWNELYKKRRIETGIKLYEVLNIQRDDKERRLAQWEANYRAFDAPAMLLFFIDKSLETGSYLDYGMFLQNIMLLAEEQGLATCPQAALGEFPSIVKKQLNMADNWNLLGGIALGYEDTEHAVNSYRTDRVDLEEFCQFFE